MENILMIGTKVYHWVEGLEKPEVLRVTSVNDTQVKLKKNDGTTEKIEKQVLLNNYTLLIPDAILGLSIVQVSDLEDVMVTVYRRKEIDEKSVLPYCVCRQNITDFFGNALDPNFSSCGMSVTLNTLPEGVPMENILACDGVNKQTSIALYIDDTLSDILGLIKSKNYDIVLYNLFMDHAKYISNKHSNPKVYFDIVSKQNTLDGYCKTLKDLLVYNNFMYDVMVGFNIYPLEVDLNNTEDKTSDEYFKFIKYLSTLLRENIVDTLILKYDKDIDLSTIENKYVLVSDKNENLYVVAYISSGKYHIPVEEVESTDNITQLYNVIHPSATSSLSEAYDMVRYNKDKYLK